MTLLRVATTNAGKLREFAELLTPLGYEVRGLADLGNPEIVEDGATFADNAVIKARAICERTGVAAVADDSGIEVEALGGAPGVHSARYAGVSGPGRDRANCDKLLAALAGVPAERRAARFVCALALCEPGGGAEIFHGELRGRIGLAPRGDNGFGYDPIVLLDDGRSIAELPSDEKNRISHRGQAVRALVAFLRARGA